MRNRKRSNVGEKDNEFSAINIKFGVSSGRIPKWAVKNKIPECRTDPPRRVGRRASRERGNGTLKNNLCTSAQSSWF